MIRQNKWKLIISSIIILFPWFLSNNDRSFIGNISPWLLIGIHWVCVIATASDPKNKDQNKKVFGLIIWSIPVLSLFIYLLDRVIASGSEFSPEIFTTLGIGFIFAVIGNYLPKCKQNYTIGIKVPWTLQDEENWNVTHRLGGKLWMAGGILIMLSAFLPYKAANILTPAILLVLVIIPIVYSWLYSRKQKKEGTFGMRETDIQMKEMRKKNKKLTKIGIAIVCMIFAACGVLLFSGNITYICEKDALCIKADYWEDSVISYEDIDAVEFRDKDEPGSRVGGFGSARLLMGNFRNEEFNYYTRYSYTGKKACIVLDVDGKTVVLGCENPKKTKELYEELLKCVQ